LNKGEDLKKRKTPNCRLSGSEIEKLVIAAEDKSKSFMESFKDCSNSVKRTEYVVNMQDEVCSCPVGKNGSPCKHMAAVTKNFDVPSTQILNCKDPKSKLDLLFIVYGESAKTPDNWFAGLQSRKTDSHTDDAVVENEEVGENVNVVENNLDDDTTSSNSNGTTLSLQPSHSPEVVAKLSNNLRDMVEDWIKNLEARPDIFFKGCESIYKQNKTLC